MSIKATRACINAILDGSINNVEFEKTQFFKLNIPKELPGVDGNLLNPRNAWPDKDAFDATAKKSTSPATKYFLKYVIAGDVDFTQYGPQA